MSFNVDKCHTICFSSKKSNLDTTCVFNNHVLTIVHHHSYLGVIFSEDLKWSEHIAHITPGAEQALGVTRRNFRNVSVACKSKLCNSLIRPKIEHANSLCFNNYSKMPGEVTNMWPSLEGRHILSPLSVFHRVVYHTSTVDTDRIMSME